MQVTYIGVHVHPFFAQATRRASQAHFIEAQLREKRDEQAIAISENDSAVLLYFPSTLTEHELVCARSGQISLTAVQDEEFQKIRAYEGILGKKFVVLASVEEKEVGQRVWDEFKTRGWEVSPQSEIYASGEMYGACVKNWAEGIRLSLGIPVERRHLVEGLSMTQERAARIQGERSI